MIPIYKPKLQTKKILEELEPVLNSGWVGLGPKVREFETKLEKHLNVKHAIALNSCTSALHLALKTITKDKGNKVITTPITFVSTNHAILYENLIPVFADVEKFTGNLDPNYVEDAIKLYGKDEIKAIIVVHLGGYPVDLDAFNYISNKYDIPIIEDCAHAFGSSYKGKNIGNTNNICCWSFQAVKNMPVGDGGAITTSNDDLDKKIRKLRWLGIDVDTVTRAHGGYKWEYMVTDVGYKYHMNDIIATIGCVQLDVINEDNLQRKQIANFYKENIFSLKNNVHFPEYDSSRESAFWFYPIFFSEREKVYQHLVDKQIYPSMHFRSNIRYPMFSNALKINECSNAKWYEENVLSLPIHLHLTNEELLFISKSVNEALL